jgi:hypothetical protein
LARVPQFGKDTCFDCGFDLGIVENDKGTVSTQLQAQFLQASGTLLCQQLPNSRTSREAQFLYQLVRTKFFANFCNKIKCCYNIDSAFGISGFLC